MCFSLSNTFNVSPIRINYHQSVLSSCVRSTGNHCSATAKKFRVVAVIHLRTEVHVKLNVADGKIDNADGRNWPVY